MKIYFSPFIFQVMMIFSKKRITGRQSYSRLSGLVQAFRLPVLRFLILIGLLKLQNLILNIFTI